MKHGQIGKGETDIDCPHYLLENVVSIASEDETVIDDAIIWQ